jgi:predicted AAA+ superfamily ATPase
MPLTISHITHSRITYYSYQALCRTVKDQETNNQCSTFSEIKHIQQLQAWLHNGHKKEKNKHKKLYGKETVHKWLKAERPVRNDGACCAHS